MKCPYCGKENFENRKKCASCGAPLPRKFGNTRFGGAIKGIGKVIIYLLVYILCSGIVTTVYEASVMSSDPEISARITEFYSEVDEKGSSASYDELANDMKEMVDFVTSKIQEKLVGGDYAILNMLYSLIFLFVLCLSFRIRKKSPMEELSVRAVNFWRIPAFILFGAALNVFISGTVALIPFPESFIEDFTKTYSVISSDKGADPILTVLSVSIVTGIVEEIVFRALIISRLKKPLGNTAALIISAAVFAFFHGTPIAMMYSFVVGIIFGLLYLKFDSIIPSMICHAMFNLTSLLIEKASAETFSLLYIASVVVVFFCFYSIFIKKPTFAAMVLDRTGEFRPATEEEKKLIEDMKSLQDRGDITPEEVQKMSDRWDELHGKNKNYIEKDYTQHGNDGNGESGISGGSDENGGSGESGISGGSDENGRNNESNDVAGASSGENSKTNKDK